MTKKKMYTRWWFWALIILAILIIITSIIIYKYFPLLEQTIFQDKITPMQSIGVGEIKHYVQ